MLSECKKIMAYVPDNPDLYENMKAIDNNIYTQIKIRDFGKGMSNIDTLNIFKRFYKGHNSSPNNIGIGLSLAKAIIEKDNGIVSVKSNKNKGTTFIIKYFY